MIDLGPIIEFVVSNDVLATLVECIITELLRRELSPRSRKVLITLQRVIPWAKWLVPLPYGCTPH